MFVEGRYKRLLRRIASRDNRGLVGHVESVGGSLGSLDVGSNPAILNGLGIDSSIVIISLENADTLDSDETRGGGILA